MQQFGRKHHTLPIVVLWVRITPEPHISSTPGGSPPALSSGCLVAASAALDVKVCFRNGHCPFLIKWIRKGAGSALQPCWLGVCCSKSTRPAPLSQRAAGFTGLATQRHGDVQGWAAHHPQWKECTYGLGGECEVLLATSIYRMLLEKTGREHRAIGRTANLWGSVARADHDSCPHIWSADLNSAIKRSWGNAEQQVWDAKQSAGLRPTGRALLRAGPGLGNSGMLTPGDGTISCPGYKCRSLQLRPGRQWVHVLLPMVSAASSAPCSSCPIAWPCALEQPAPRHPTPIWQPSSFVLMSLILQLSGADLH